MIIDEDALAHYGQPRRSGRYPWGSGGDENARNRDFLGMYGDLKNHGLDETAIAEAMGFARYDKEGNKVASGTTQLRNRRTIALNAEKAEKIVRAEKLKATGMSTSAIAREMGINESSVRSLLAPGQKDKNAIINGTAEVLKKEIGKNGILDIGAGAEHLLGVGRSKLDAAISLLEEEGYIRSWVKIPQLGTNHETTYKVLAAPGMDHKQVYARRGEIKQVQTFSEDGGRSFEQMHYPHTLSSKNVSVKWGDEGGSEADGMIYIRPGVEGLSLGKSNYAQVRINVDDTHFLKGMAIYKDDLPPGVNVEFNTNKPKSASKFDAMKPLKKDIDGNVDFMKSVKRQRGVLNIVNEEGEWDEWTKNLSSQMLSKQRSAFAKQQLDILHERKRAEMDEILSLTNPLVKKKLLDEFADGVDASAVDLEAAGLPRTRNHVILPLSKIKPDEIYAPNFNNGEKVALIRHPHGGIFEIPNLTVNNNNPAAKKAFGQAKDAVGIHHSVAEKLSGADFDGDTVLVIPNNKGQIKHANTLEQLKNFDPKSLYKKYDGMEVMSERVKQREMGNISNLITDMTIKGASHDEIARAIRHSMVVIDAEKHELNWKQSEIDHGIQQLKNKWQKDGTSRGASTLISRAGARVDVRERKQLVKIDPKTGKKIYTESGANFVDKNGDVVFRTQRSQKLAETDNAFTLVGKPPTVIETVYATHSNRLKAMANEARKEQVNTKLHDYSPAARKAHATEVASLKAKLLTAQRNAPLERQAQIVGNAQLRARIKANPNMDKETKKKLKNQLLKEARFRTGAGKTRIQITPAEWAAIQAGAVTNGMLKNILDNADMDLVRELATPRQKLLMTSSKKAQAQRLLAKGYTQAEVAMHLGVSLTTLKVSLRKES